MKSYPIFFGTVTEATYIYGGQRFSGAYVNADPASGTVLVEVTCAPELAVRAVEEGTPDASVLWESWLPGASADAATGTVYVPWTAIRVTATNCAVNIAGTV